MNYALTDVPLEIVSVFTNFLVGTVTEQVVLDWIEEDKALISSTLASTPVDWKITYFQLLQVIYHENISSTKRLRLE